MTPPLPLDLANAVWWPVLADIALKSTLLLALAALLVQAQRKSSSAVRHLIWSVALLGAILLPLLSLLLPAWPVSALDAWWPSVSSAPAVAPTRSVLPATITTPMEMPSANPSTQAADAPAPIPVIVVHAVSPATMPVVSAQNFKLADFLVRFIGLIWLIGAALALLPLLIGSWQVARLTRHCSPLDSPEWTILLENAKASLSLRRRVRLLSSPRVLLPMTYGAWHPVILLPESACDWPELRRRVVLRHELAHVQRGDWLTGTLAYGVCAFYWYNPLVWHAARRMRLEREQACDDLVLRRNTLPSDYAGELLQLAAGFSGHRLIDWATVPMASCSAFEGRLLAILDEQRNRTGITCTAIVGALVFVAVVIVPVAMLQAASATTDLPTNTLIQLSRINTYAPAVNSPPNPTTSKKQFLISNNAEPQTSTHPMKSAYLSTLLLSSVGLVSSLHAQNSPPPASTTNVSGPQHWVVTDGVAFKPWTFDLTIGNGTVTGSAGQARNDPPSGFMTSLVGPFAVYDGTVNGNTIDFKLKTADDGRIVTFHGTKNGNQIAFTRSVQVVSGDPGRDGILGASGATQFTATLNPATSSDSSATPAKTASVATPSVAPVSGGQHWVVADGVAFKPWTFDLNITDTTVTGSAGQARNDPPSGYMTSLIGPFAVYDGTVSGNTIDFKLKTADGGRIVTFHGTKNGNQIAFTRSVQVVSGDPGRDGILGASGAKQFTAVLGSGN